ncbi:MAG: hypothetical protein HY283_00560 [Nitrospirae bacterium]|nr:hypothetical protein [Nitrospirota bacterium]
MTRRNLLAVFIAASLIVGISVSVWAEKQPHMKGALESLKRAKVQLEKAAPDKGGHRATAMKLVDQAIEEVKAGMEFANEH